MNHTHRKRLYKSRKNRVIAGVAGGIAEYLNIDPTIIRVIFVIAAFIPPAIGILIYIVLMLAVPLEPEGPEVIGEKVREKKEDWSEDLHRKIESLAEEFKIHPPRSSRARNFFGAVIIILGIFLLIGELIFAFAPCSV